MNFIELGKEDTRLATDLGSTIQWSARGTSVSGATLGIRLQFSANVGREAFCLRNEWFTIPESDILRRSFVTAIAPVLRMLILFAMTFGVLPTFCGNRVVFPQAP